MTAPVSQTLPLDVALQQALAHHRAGRLSEAEDLYRAILHAQPDQADANHNLGVLAMQVGQHAAALPYLKVAFDANPTQGQYVLSYAEALLTVGQAGEALTILRGAQQRGIDTAAVHALRQRAEAATSATAGEAPSAAEMHQLVALFNAGRHAEVESRARLLVERHPDCGVLWMLLGASAHTQGKSGLPALRKAVELLPDDAEAHNNLGIALQALGQLDAAVASYRRALQIKPDLAEAHSNLGNALQALGELDEAVASYRRALGIKPSLAEAHSNMGLTLQALGQLDEAIASHRRALEIEPGLSDAHNNLGNTLYQLGQLDAAVASYVRALNIKPDFAVVHSNLGIALKDLGQLDKAMSSYRRALEIKPDFAEAHSNLIFCLDMMATVGLPEVHRELAKWDEVHAAPLWREPVHGNERSPTRRLRVGYVSGDLREHSAAKTFVGILTQYDRSQFEVFAYSNFNGKGDGFTERFRQGVTRWRDIGHLSDEAAAQLIREDRIDILVDLSGHSAGNRLLVFARKPAPIQITGWGYGSSTGMRAMDVFFTDRVLVPPEDKQYFSEEVRYQASAWACYSIEPFPEVNELPALSEGILTFGSFNRLAKVSERAYDAWAAVLQALPGSRLMLKTGELEDALNRERVAGHFARAGVAPERVMMLGKTPWNEHVQAYNRVDLTLDPFPHGGGVTTLEGLMMGVPVITLRWPSRAGRLSASIVTALGLSDWIAETQEQYVELAVRKASDLRSLAALRGQLRGIVTSALGDQQAYVRSVEAEYRQMWQRWCASPSPDRSVRIQ